MFYNVIKGDFMEELDTKTGNLPFELAQISKPARNYLKMLATSMVQHKDLPERDAEMFTVEEDAEEERE
jgi:hypothetical protein